MDAARVTKYLLTGVATIVYTHMKFEWDEHKRQSNLFKHGIDFASARQVLERDSVVSFPDERYSDNRWIAYGFLDAIPIQIAFQQLNGDTIRIISMRKATRRERKHLYAEFSRSIVIQDGGEE